MNKRYAIVRVDNTWCPNKFENIDNRFVCDSRRKNIKRVHCERCNYGDTKEQLERKVEQVLRRKIKDDKIVYIGISKKRNIRIKSLSKENSRVFGGGIMKGFIEVTPVFEWNLFREYRTILINIEDIRFVFNAIDDECISENHQQYTSIYLKDYVDYDFCYVSDYLKEFYKKLGNKKHIDVYETYEEIKQKIKEAKGEK